MDDNLLAVAQSVSVNICYYWACLVYVDFDTVTESVFVGIRQLKVGFVDVDFIRIA